MKDAPSVYVGSMEWETRRDDEEMPIGADPAHVKLPSLFLNKQWDLSSKMAIPAVVAVELPRPDESLADSRERHCRFQLQKSDRFGMVLDENLEPFPTGLLVVTRLDAGSAFERTEQDGCGLMAGDVIVEVNNTRGTAAELRSALHREFAAQGQTTVELVVRGRPPTFNIEVRRNGPQWNKLGLAAVGDKSSPGCLLVQGVHAEGLIPEWNAAHGSLHICKGDLITHVNDVCKDDTAMKGEVKQSSAKGSRLRFRIVTPVGKALGHHRDFEEEDQGFAWPETTVPWDMQVRWLDDCRSEVSTTCDGSGGPSGTRTPEDSCPSGTRTPEDGSMHTRRPYA